MSADRLLTTGRQGVAQIDLWRSADLLTGHCQIDAVPGIIHGRDDRRRHQDLFARQPTTGLHDEVMRLPRVLVEIHLAQPADVAILGMHCVLFEVRQFARLSHDPSVVRLGDVPFILRYLIVKHRRRHSSLEQHRRLTQPAHAP